MKAGVGVETDDMTNKHNRGSTSSHDFQKGQLK